MSICSSRAEQRPKKKLHVKIMCVNYYVFCIFVKHDMEQEQQLGKDMDMGTNWLMWPTTISRSIQFVSCQFADFVVCSANRISFRLLLQKIKIKWEKIWMCECVRVCVLYAYAWVWEVLLVWVRESLNHCEEA